MEQHKNKKTISNEAKVGIWVLISLFFAIGFAWLLGVQNPFKQTVEFYVTYHFAGGIEVGSPVRVSGIKVGKVEKIEFFSPEDLNQKLSVKEPGSANEKDEVKLVTAPLRLRLSIQKDAARGVRSDSRFYINLAGIIGERYIEITPGSIQASPLKELEVYAGVDPPRIDQLISQSFDLAGKIKEIIDDNKGDITRSIDLLYKLSGNLNQTLTWMEKSKVFKTDLSLLIENLIIISNDVKRLTAKANSPQGEKTLKLLHDLLWRLEPLDSKAVRDFMQKEGVKVKMF